MNNNFTKKQLNLLNIFAQQKILILGAGREGLSTYSFLRQIFPQQLLAIADRTKLIKLNPLWTEIFSNDENLIGIFGPHYLNSLSQFKFVFKTPGIPSTFPEILQSIQSGTIFTSNTEWFLKLARGKTIGVTGTKGKSTTSSLIAHFFTNAGRPALLLGNIGTPPLSYLDQTKSNTISVLELSAHQLQDLHQSPNYAVVQNITSEHLDYYKTTAQYIEAKKPIVKYQHKTDFVIFSDEFKNSRLFASLTPATQLCYGLKPNSQHLAYISGHTLFWQGNSYPESIINLRKVKLLGKHNLYNLMPAVILAKVFNISNEQIEIAASTFTPLRHRLEHVTTVKQVSYYNDSLSTTPEATLAAIKIFPLKNLHLIAGGYERNQDFSRLAAQILNSSIKTLILFPTTGSRLKRNVIDLAIKKKLLVPDFYEVKTMIQAVKIAAQQAKPQDIVLLSPCSASFGSFKDYADRGDQFCAAAKNLL